MVFVMTPRTFDTGSTSRYATLRRVRTVLRWTAPIAGSAIGLSGVVAFGYNAISLVSGGFAGGFTIGDRIRVGMLALSYLFGMPLLGFALQWTLRAIGDAVDLAIDAEVALEKMADLLERQGVPSLLRAAQSIEKATEANERQLAGTAAQICESIERVESALARLTEITAAGMARLAAESAAVSTARSRERTDAFDNAQRVVAAGPWLEAHQRVQDIQERFPDDPRAPALAAALDARRKRDAAELRALLDESQTGKNPDLVLDLRDRLSKLLDETVAADLDRQVARWCTVHLRESLADGRASDTIETVERVVRTFGDTINDVIQLRAALPMLRRGAGRCPDCGEPYDVRLARCVECAAKRPPVKLVPTSPNKPADGAKRTAADRRPPPSQAS